MGFEGASGFHPPGGGGGGGTIGGGGTLNYVAMFTPDGTHIGNAPIKIGDTITRAFPVNTGTDTIGMGFDIAMSGIDNILIGYNLTDGGGNEVYALGNRLFLTGAPPGSYYGIIALGFFNTFDTSGGFTSGIYLMGDSNVFNDYNTYSTILGEDNVLTRIDHCTIIGLFSDITDSVRVFTLGENNDVNLSVDAAVFGVNNTLDTVNNIVAIGLSNAISGINDAVVIGIGNLNALTNEILIAINDAGIRIDLSGDVGIGIPSTDTIMARLHNRGVHTNNVNQRLEPVVGVYEDTTGETLTLVSVGVTTSTLQTIPIPLDTVVLIESYVTARKTAGAGVGAIGDGNGYVRTVKAKNVAGVVTIGVIQSSFTSEDIGPLNATFDVSGTDVRVRVTNSANQTINWNVITKTYPVT